MSKALPNWLLAVLEGWGLRPDWRSREMRSDGEREQASFFSLHVSDIVSLPKPTALPKDLNFS